MSKVGMPGVDIGLQKEDPTIAELLKPLGYATGQFGKNHLGELNKYLPTAHGFDEFYGNLYHLNAGEESGGSFLCADSYCMRYRPAARRPQMIDTGMSHIGFRCVKNLN